MKGVSRQQVAAQAKVGRHRRVAGQALRRIDQVQQGLHSHSALLTSAAMQPPILTDRAALTRNRARATALFLQDLACARFRKD